MKSPNTTAHTAQTSPTLPSIAAADLGFFAVLVRSGSLSAAARELKLSTAAVSKRLAQMEKRLGLALVTRSTRRMGLTVEGEIYLSHARAILAQMADLERELGGTKASPSGLLRVNATLGFGRTHLAPLIAEFAQLHPKVEVRLQLSVDPPALSEDAYDVCIRFGPPPDARIVAHKLADNQRLLCAAPSYLAQRGVPQTPQDLARHDFISIRQGDDAYGVLRLRKAAHPGADKAGSDNAVWQTVKTRGRLTTNDGGIAVAWALQGLGIVLRAQWDVRSYLQSAALVQVLPHYQTPDADIYAVYPPQHQSSARVREFVQFVKARLQPSV